MSLVAYDVSGDSGGSEDEVEEDNNDKKMATIGPDVAKLIQGSDEPNRLFAALPRPRNIGLHADDAGIDRMLFNSKKGISDEPPMKKMKNQPVKISIPSLSEFEAEDIRPAKTKPSEKGSGLFSLLPPPKNLKTKEHNRVLVPNPVLKAKSKPTTVPMSKPVKLFDLNRSNSDDDSDTDPSIDFFKLNQPDPLLADEVFERDNFIDLTVEEDEPKTKVLPSQIEEDTNFIPTQTDNLELDDKAMRILCGGNAKRQQQKKNQMDIIDLAGEQFMPKHEEWMLKQLTEEKKAVSQNQRKSAGPSNANAKRKHQITYLAFQAKEQEQELQNQWAQNRMTRKQTQSKYGF